MKRLKPLDLLGILIIIFSSLVLGIIVSIVLHTQQTKPQPVELPAKKVTQHAPILSPQNKIHKVHATVYHAVKEQCNNNPGVTASGFKINIADPYSHRIIAVSQDLREEYPYGSVVIVEAGDYSGIYTVEDTMNKRFTDRIDILIKPGMPLISRDATIKLIRNEKFN